MNPSRIYQFAMKFSLALFLVAVGTLFRQDFWGDEISRAFYPQYFYWTGSALLVFLVVFGKKCRAAVAYVRFQARLRKVLPGLGRERQVLQQAAITMHREQEERAIAILEDITDKADPEVQKTARWLRALSGTRWLMRNRRTVSNYRERFPQVHALVFSHGRVPLRRQMLAKEMADCTSRDMDQMVTAYIDLIDAMIAALDNHHSPFEGQAEEVLEFLTGRVYVLSARERYSQWWQPMRRLIGRGGGALLVGVRLLQREYYQEASQMLERLGQDGLLSQETETVRRMAAFFALIVSTQLRITNTEIPRFFRDLHYHGCVEMGVLRYPTAEIPEVIECCRNAQNMREAKRGFLDDVFHLWGGFNEELAGHCAALLKRLLDMRGRKCPSRLAYWKDVWAEKSPKLDESVMRMMEGVVAVAEGRQEDAQKVFAAVSALDPSMSAPLVNQVYLCLVTGKEDEARKLAEEAGRRFGQDAGAMISLGRLFATHLEDTQEAERLFQRARDLDKSSTEPLICLGEVKLMEGKYIESQKYFDWAAQIDPSSLEAKLGLARTYMETQRYDGAVSNLLSVARDGRGDARHLAHYLLYRTYRDKGDNDQAINYLDKVPTPFFKEPDELDDIAFHLEREKQYAKARVFSERAMLLRARGRPQTDHFDGSEAI